MPTRIKRIKLDRLARSCGLPLGKIAGTRLFLLESTGDTIEYDPEERPQGGEYRRSIYLVVPVWPSRAAGWIGDGLERKIRGAVCARWRGQARITLEETLRVVQVRRWGRTVPAVEAYVRADPC